LKRNIEKYGFLVPIITNNKFVVADGEHRLKAAIEIGMTQVPVIALPIEEVDRRIIRQVMNKLKGHHDIDMDAEEYKLILEDTTMDEFIELLSKSEEDIRNTIDKLNDEESDSIVDDVSKVDSLGHITIICPKCKHRFEKEDSK